MMMWHLQVLTAVGLLWLTAPAHAQESCVCLEQFGTEDLYNPTFFKTAPGDDDRIFVGEQIGHVWIYDRVGNRNAEPFLNVSERFNIAGYDERGLLGMDFHPDYQNNRKYYVYFSRTGTGPGTADYTQVSEFQADESNPDATDMTTERMIIEFEQPQTNHNGGEIFFGLLDGYLYIFLGDGGTNHNENAQDMTTHHGKVLRIDVDTGDDGIPYLIPDDNPFLDEPGALPEIYGLGLRNPWRCTQDEGDSEGVNRGRVMCGDVGQNYCEEVDIVIAGGNFGWNVKECVFCYPPDLPDPDPECPIEVFPGEEVLPIFYYVDWAGSQSITGGHVYRGSALPEFDGGYFWSDWAIRDHNGTNRLMENEDGTWTNIHVPLCDATTCGDGLLSEHQFYAFAFGLDQDSELYICESSSVSPSQGGGVVYKMVPPPGKKNA